MGTEIHYKGACQEYYSMREVNEDSNSSSWSIFYGDKSLTNGHYYNGFLPRTVTDAYPGYDKDALKRKMLEHEAIFRNQVYELHRLYRRQRDMMEEIKQKELHKQRISIDTSSSSSHLPSQKPYEDAHRWQIPTFPLANSTSTKPSIFGADISNSPLSCSKGNNISKDFEVMECNRPSKVRKKLFDLELPPDENVDQASEDSSHKDTSSGQRIRGSNGLTDLNEPVHVEEATARAPVDDLGSSAKPAGSWFLGQPHELNEKPLVGLGHSGVFNHLSVVEKGNGRDWLSNKRETGSNNQSNMNFTSGTYSEITTRIQDHPQFNPFTASHTSSAYPFTNSPDLGSSWGKSNGGLTHKLTSFQKHPSFLPPPQSQEVFGDKWRMNGCYKPNGFYQGSSSGAKDPPTRVHSSGFDRRNCSNLDGISQKIFKGSNFIDLTETTKGADLNMVQNDENGQRKCGQTALPWLQAKNGELKNGKILGFPIFGNSCVSKNDSSSLASTSASLRSVHENGKVKKEMENRGFDINVAWDDRAETCEHEKETETEKVKIRFDLNSCVTEGEDEDFLVPESVKKMAMEIDLEAPAVPEVEEEEEEAVDDDVAKVAAEAIVEMSSQQDPAGPTSDMVDDRLMWFAEAVEKAGPVLCELDEYEALTLQLEETKEEDYMPKPLGLGVGEPDETGPARPRRGQARRGRPRRDFQRDILPGLVSLSRHEVTEDLQIFGGLMRATGHSWNVGLTRRNGTRGRRKSVAEPPPAATPQPPPPPPPLAEVVGLEERSLTGWGKTTRRPRRQRCGGSAGNSVAVPLT